MIPLIMEDCVSSHCGCEYSKAGELLEGENFKLYRAMEMIERTIYEAELTKNLPVAPCNTECSFQCLSNSQVSLKGQEACLYKACKCRLNLYFLDHCNEKCLDNCNLLSGGEERKRKCSSECGCEASPALEKAES
mmetsp:Transcript_36568/g.35371  ORF Transcript_36568/g.35371 Transcript_36568/m.35371 type:complete len:135 (-) Transcript_36568:313-717(-)